MSHLTIFSTKCFTRWKVVLTNGCTRQNVVSTKCHAPEFGWIAKFSTFFMFQVVNGFSGQSDPEIKGKVITRLQNITEMQKILMTCLAGRKK